METKWEISDVKYLPKPHLPEHTQQRAESSRAWMRSAKRVSRLFFSCYCCVWLRWIHCLICAMEKESHKTALCSSSHNTIQFWSIFTPTIIILYSTTQHYNFKTNNERFRQRRCNNCNRSHAFHLNSSIKVLNYLFLIPFSLLPINSSHFTFLQLLQHRCNYLKSNDVEHIETKILIKFPRIATTQCAGWRCLN